ncbi:hypothetical protein ABT246_40525 [Streptomyces sp. NPDC001553]
MRIPKEAKDRLAAIAAAEGLSLRGPYMATAPTRHGRGRRASRVSVR